MRRSIFTLSIFGLLAVAAFAAAEEPSAADLEFFEKRIRPVLVARCYECHSADAAEAKKLKGGLGLDTRAATLAGGDSGPAVVPGNPAESLLLSALKYDGLKMPPTEQLSAEVVSDFETWIATGAVDPREGAVAKKLKGMSIEDGRHFWSFIPPSIAPLPAVNQSDWPSDSIDLRLLAAMEANGLQPVGEADPRTLVRRLAFDLLGMPPESSDVEAFAADPTPLAWEALVDRWLASPRFGERWGRHWLDVARYAESNGRDRNYFYFHAWRYRDYVLDCFSADKPVDAFLVEQLAGDLLPSATREQRDERRVATAFLALGAKALDEQNADIFRMDVVDEQIETVSRAMLGLSVGCARCHDHKFDPIPTADYYALAGIFRSTRPLSGVGPKGTTATDYDRADLYAIGPEAESLGPAAWAFVLEVQRLFKERTQISIDRYGVVRRESATRLELEQPGADKEKLSADLERMVAEIKVWDEKWEAAKAALEAAYDQGGPPQPGWTLGAREGETIEDCRVHVRGETTNLGDLVPRGMLQVASVGPRLVEDRATSGRLELAHWIVDRSHPLTARVYVNRVWQQLFGRGLVATPDDFGVNGARPSHPELLDELAVRFMEEGWSTKRLIRRLVLTQAYRLASEATIDSAAAFALSRERDPDNVLLARHVPRRLEAEILRDSVLHSAGTLDLSRPAPERTTLGKLNPYREDEYRPFAPSIFPDKLEHSHRGVYSPVVRNVLPEMYSLFDFAPPDRTTAQRNESAVPAQALFFLNNPWVQAQARAWAKSLLADPTIDDSARVEAVFELAYARRPSAEESAAALRYLSESQALDEVRPPSDTPANSGESLSSERKREDAWTNWCQIVFASGEFRYVP